MKYFKTLTITHSIEVERIEERLYAVTTDRGERLLYEASTADEAVEIYREDLNDCMNWNPKREAQGYGFGGVEEVYHDIGEVRIRATRQ